MKRETGLRAMYEAFNVRDIEAVLRQMTVDVDWPNAWEGGRVHGRDAVREYWTRQWSAIDPTVKPVGFTQRPDGIIAVEVDQVARGLDGTLLGEGRVLHVYRFANDLIARMDVEELTSATVTLEPWGSGDLPLLERLMGDPRMTEHLGGPESPDKLSERQGRYERLEGGDRMFKTVDVASGAGVGSVGFWTTEWHDKQVYEVGWMVVPESQGRGIAVAATAQAIELAKRDDKHRFMHAFPNVDNVPSNAICRKLGFELLEACEVEFPKGHFMTCNDWCLDLRA